MEREYSAHIEDGDLDGDDVAGLLGRLGIVFLAERHDVHTLGTKRRANGQAPAAPCRPPGPALSRRPLHSGEPKHEMV